MRGLWAVACLVMLSGCINDFDDGVVQNHVSIRAIDVAAPEIRSGSITFAIDVVLSNEMARSGELLMVVKAYDTATDLLVDTVDHPVGRIDAEKTRVVELDMVLPRETGYRLQVTIFQDDEIMANHLVALRNLDALEPNIRETGVGVTSIDFFVDNATAVRVHITASLYVTNEGIGPSDPIRAQVKAREVTTGIIADEAWIDIPALPPEETHKHDALMDVPEGYNYAIEAVLWDDQFIVGRHTGNVQLLPTFEVPEGSTIEVQRPSLGDFSRGGDDGEEARSPGLGLVTALIIIGGIAWMKRRT